MMSRLVLLSIKNHKLVDSCFMLKHICHLLELVHKNYCVPRPELQWIDVGCAYTYVRHNYVNKSCAWVKGSKGCYKLLVFNNMPHVCVCMRDAYSL